MRKNNAAFGKVVFCICLLMIFVIVGRQINSQGITRSKSVKKSQPTVDLSEGGILTGENSDFRQNTKGKQSAVAIAPLVGSDLGNEIEPNDTFATANPLGGSEVKIRGDVYPNGDVDWFSFTAGAGDRVYSAVMTAYSSNSGRVADARGNGVANALVTLTDFNGNVHSARTNSFGNYTINEIQVGESYAAAVRHRELSFPSQVITVNNDLTGVNFTAEE